MSFSDDEFDRYARHIVLKDIGGAGQMRLKSAKIALIGAGGIGAPAALYLAAAGVGHLTIIDDDVVSLSNLQRQVLFATDDVDKPKVERAKSHLTALNPHVDIRAEQTRLSVDNAEELLCGHDLIIDGCDNFETRFLVNRVAQRLRIPLISAALGRFEGQLSLFDGSPCYQCFVPDIPPEAETCERVGVVGALCGIMGSMAALEAIKWITGAGECLKGKLLHFDGLTMKARVANLQPDPYCPVCKGDS